MKLARMTGIAFLLLAVASFVSFGFSDPGVESSGEKQEFIKQVSQVPGNGTLGFGQTVQVATAALAVLGGVGLYLLLRRRSPGLGLGGLLTLVLWGVFTGLQGIVGAAMVDAAKHYLDGGLIAAQNDATLEIISLLGSLHWGAWLSTWSFLGLSILVFSLGLGWTARLGPRLLSWLGVVPGVLLSLTVLVTAIEVYFMGWFLGFILSEIWLVAIGIWLLARANKVGATAQETAAV